MNEDVILLAAELIKARNGIDRLIASTLETPRQSWLVELGTSLEGGKIYDTNAMIPTAVVMLGLHRMVEALAEQIAAIQR